MTKEYNYIYAGDVTQLSDKVAFQVRLQDNQTLTLWSLYPVDGGWAYSSAAHGKGLLLKVDTSILDYLIGELEAARAVSAKLSKTATKKPSAKPAANAVKAKPLSGKNAANKDEVILEAKKANRRK